jgi:hypothetical protein
MTVLGIPGGIPAWGYPPFSFDHCITRVCARQFVLCSPRHLRYNPVVASLRQGSRFAHARSTGTPASRRSCKCSRLTPSWGFAHARRRDTVVKDKQKDTLTDTENDRLFPLRQERLHGLPRGGSLEPVKEEEGHPTNGNGSCMKRASYRSNSLIQNDRTTGSLTCLTTHRRYPRRTSAAVPPPPHHQSSSTGVCLLIYFSCVDDKAL